MTTDDIEKGRSRKWQTTIATQTVRSADGTLIAFDRLGSGPGVILISGASADRRLHRSLAEALAGNFTVFNYDRRARGESGDTLPLSIEREFEDIDALMKLAGGSAHLYGISSGGGLALEATAAGLTVDRLAVYEVPYSLDDDQPRVQAEYVAALERAGREGKPGDQAEVFLRVMGSDDEAVAQARASDWWPGMVANERSLAYDAASVGTGQPPTDRLARIKVPTLVLTGDPEGEHEVGSKQFFEAAARAIVAAIPNAVHKRLPGQTHAVDPAALSPVLTEFYKG